MSALRERLLEPSPRYDVDLESRWGLLQAGLHLVAFAALVVLAILLDVIEPGGTASEPTTSFWVVLVAGAVVGVGMVWLVRFDRIDRLWRTVAGRLVTVLGLSAAFWGLLLAVGLDAVFAGLAFLVARVAAHLWRVRRARS